MTISKALRTGYYDALSGNVSVPVYDTFAPEGSTTPYIILSSQLHVQRAVKGCKVYDSSILVDVVTRNIDTIGFSQAEDIVEEVENVINPDTFIDIDLTAYGYSIGYTEKGDDSQLSTKDNNYYVYRQLLRYNHLISKI